MTEWSRSRFWLSHFLYSRHERPRLKWDSGGIAPGWESRLIASWLSAGLTGAGLGGASMVRSAVQRHADDPAFLQTIRLLAKEREYHSSLMAKLAGRWGAAVSGESAARTVGAEPLIPRSSLSLPGVRFELSLLLVSGLIDTEMLRLMATRTEDVLTRDVAAALRRDLAHHRAFCVERLTMEFADFSFVRRNLRRWRLRMVFAGALTRHVWRQRELLAAAGMGYGGFWRGAWASFETTLERMVPYRREALLAALLRQKDRPFEDTVV